MCYSFRTSIVSFSLGMIACIFAFSTRQYVLGTLILFYTQMQLSEALIWRGIDTNNKSLNRTGTAYGKYLLASHVFAIGLGLLLVYVFLHQRRLKLIDFIPIIIGLAFFLSIVFLVYQRKNYSDTTYPVDKSCVDRKCQNNKNRLKWPYPHDWYGISFLITLIFIFVYIRPTSTKFLLSSVFIITFIFTYLIVPKSVGSVWCFSAAILAPVIVGVNYFLIRNKTSQDIVT